VCVTRENYLTLWINFEAGALFKAFGGPGKTPVVLRPLNKSAASISE
jgi:hypothetical protein